jgi:hypothetical protein
VRDDLRIHNKSQNVMITMTTLLVTPQLQSISTIKQRIATEIEALMASLPDINDLSREERRGMIARYSAVLEGNFIY